MEPILPVEILSLIAGYCDTSTRISWSLTQKSLMVNIDRECLVNAIKHCIVDGNLGLLTYFYKQGYQVVPNWDILAALHNHLDILTYLAQQEDESLHYDTVICAISNRNLEMVKFCVGRNVVLNYYTASCTTNTEGILPGTNIEEDSLEILKYLRGAKCPWDGRVIENAISSGFFNIVKYCVQNGCSFGPQVYTIAACHNRIDMIEWLLENTLVRFDGCSSITAAARNGHLDCVMFLREKGSDWNVSTCYEAIHQDHSHVVKYLIENGCPYDSGIRTLVKPGSKVFNWMVEQLTC